jgi:RND family efflux transporter MFP subunit
MPGSVHAFEHADLYAQASGYLDKLNVDIGDRVHKDQLLAEIAVPDRVQEVQRREACVKQAEAQVQQAIAQRAAAEAGVQAAEAVVKESDAIVEKCVAAKNLADKQYRRIRDLYKSDSIEEKLVDEKEEARSAAIAAETAARAGIISAKAKLAAAKADVELATANVANAKANVNVCTAELEKARVLVAFAKITSPYNGVISRRSYHPGAFIRDAEHGGAVPILTVLKDDVMRVVVQIADRDAPFADPGDPAQVEIDALPGIKFNSKISRIADSEDPASRTMRVEIDLPNPKGVLRDGMYGRATIRLAMGSARGVRIPTSALIGNARDGEGAVYVVRDGKATRQKVRLGADNGVEMEVVDGLTPDDLVVFNYSGSLSDGLPVEAVLKSQASSAK